MKEWQFIIVMGLVFGMLFMGGLLYAKKSRVEFEKSGGKYTLEVTLPVELRCVKMNAP